MTCASQNNLTFMYENIIDTTMIQAGYINSNFPLTNLLTDDKHEVCRTTARDDVTFLIDLGASNSVEYDTLAIANTNLTSSGLVKLGRGSSFPPTLATVSCYGDYFIYYWDTTSTNRYINVYCSEDTAEGYIQIGMLWIGERTELGVNPQIPIKIIDRKAVTDLQTGGGQIWSYVDYEQRGYDMKFVVDLFPSDYDSLLALHKSRGYEKPYFFHLAPADSNDSVFLAHTEKFLFDIDGKDARPGSWTVEEEL